MLKPGVCSQVQGQVFVTWIRAQIFLLELAQELDIGTNLLLKSRPEIETVLKKHSLEQGHVLKLVS